MYWPYLRNRTNEVFAILELAPIVAAAGRVIPILKVVSYGSADLARLHRIATAGQRFCLIVNSDGAGITSSVAVAVQQAIQSINTVVPGSALAGLEITANTNIADVSGFASMQGNSQAVLIHGNHGFNANVMAGAVGGFFRPPVHVYYQGHATQNFMGALPSAGHVYLSDPFQRQQVNGAYPKVSQFDNKAMTHKSLGFGGFGDFCTIGDYYRVGGGQASHVAVHLTEKINSTVVCNHFVSHSSLVNAHIHAKYDDAMLRLRAGVGAPVRPSFSTLGSSHFLSPHSYAGLGMAKRWSIKHHVELMERTVAVTGAPPFI